MADRKLAEGTSESKAESPAEEAPKAPKPRTLLDEITGAKELAAPKAADGFYVSDDDWRILVRNIQTHVNTMIVGPTGCGKTSVVQEICKKMGKKLHIFDMGTMVDPISSLLGVHRLEKGASVFDYAKFTQVIKEPCVVLLDELSRAPLTTMNILFSCLDDRRNLNIEIACGSGEREIQVHPEVTFIATANVGSEYSGANSMDRALVNRFFLLELGCIPVKEEVNVLVSRTGIDKTSAELIVKIANNIRSLCNKQEISVSLSIRETLMVAKLASDGWSLAKAMEMIYLPLYEGTKSDGERSTVYKTISSY
jgi:MoxR-like ATPase